MGSRFPDLRNKSSQYQKPEAEYPESQNDEFGWGDEGDRELVFSRPASFHQSAKPHAPIFVVFGDSVRPGLSSTASSIKRYSWSILTFQYFLSLYEKPPLS
ncbi:hypothetical protein U1Q18_039568 [Sarracenia purpurea var. burkii]